MSHYPKLKSITGAYRVYTALLSQTGTDAPVATVLENTLGVDVTYEREMGPGGIYKLLFSNPILTENNHFIISSPATNNYYTIAFISYISSPTELRIESYDFGNLDIITSGFTANIQPGDNKLNNYPIEIRVYF